MVEIREEETLRGEDAARAQEQPSTSSRAAPSSAVQAQSWSEFVTSRRIDCLLFVCRIFTMFFAISFMLPSAAPSVYYKSLAAAAATNALRLQQRLGAVTLSREFAMRLMLEDSCHYLLYCVLFLVSAPLSLSLLPLSLYAALHAANFSVAALQATGSGSSSATLRLSSLASSQTANCLGIVACSEIFLVPLLLSLIVVGKASFFIPFIYYRFLTLRYASRRNPYTRQAFYEMRCSLESVARSPSCPSLVSASIHRCISALSALSPSF